MTRVATGALTLALIVFSCLLVMRAPRTPPEPAKVSTLVCLGDSNTAGPTSWCGLLANALPVSWRVVNRARGGSLVDHPGGWQNGREQLEAALAEDDPDVVFLAFGTNDLLLSFTYRKREKSLARLIRPIVAGYERVAEKARRSGARVFVALTPPFCEKLDHNDANINDFVRALNRSLQRAFPADEIVDFHSPVAADDYVGADCVHLNENGQQKRLRAACAALARARVARCRPPPAPPP